MTLAKAKAKTNETFIVQASCTIVTYDCQNMFIVQATNVIFREYKIFFSPRSNCWGWTRTVDLKMLGKCSTTVLGHWPDSNLVFTNGYREIV